MRYFSLLLAIIPLLGSAQISFKHYMQKDGLADNYVEDALEDSHGFLWFATHQGISKFDGTSFETIKIPESNLPNFLMNMLTCVKEDGSGHLWFGSMGGVVIYNPFLSTFNYINPYTDKITISDNNVNDIEIVNGSDVWIATRNGLNLLSLKDSSVKHFYSNATLNLSGDNIIDLQFDSNNNLWIGTETGLSFYSYDENKFHFVSELGSGSIRSIFEDSRKKIWVAISKKGIYTKNNNSSEFIECMVTINGKQTSLKSTFSSINEDNIGRIWIGSFVDGITIVDPISLFATRILEDNLTTNSLSGNSIDKILKDAQENIWVCTHGGGVNFHSPLLQNVQFYSKSENALGGRIVSSFIEFADDEYWIGTDGGGISKFNYKTKTFKTFNKDNGLSSNAVLCLAKINENTIAIATWNGGLSLFNTTSNTFSNYYYTKYQAENNIQHLEYDSTQNVLYCATQNRGIRIFDMNSKAFINHPENNSAILALDEAYITSFIRNKGKIQVIAESYDLFHATGNEIRSINNENNSSECEKCFYVVDMDISNSGKVYLASQMGFYELDTATLCCKLADTSQKNQTSMRAVALDKDNTVWITSEDELFRYFPSNKAMVNISNKWGIPRMQYFKQALFIDSKGRLFLGGGNGFAVMNNVMNWEKQIEPEIFLAKLYIHNVLQIPNSSSSILNTNIAFTKSISIDYDDAYIGIEFSALNFIDPQKNKFKYKLDGFDKNWTISKNPGRITYTNLPKGNYTFRVLCTDSNGNWGKEERTLKITVYPPWWQTYWFRGFATFIIITLVVLVVKIRERNMKVINKKLELQVNQRTEELNSINEELKVQAETINLNYQELKEKQVVIQMKNHELQDSISTKDRLLQVIGHDFRNPLGALNGLLNLFVNKIQDKLDSSEMKSVESIQAASETLLNQMNQVLEWSASKDEDLKYNPTDISLDTVITDAISLVSEMAKMKRITIELNFNFGTTAHIDARMISIVLRNLVSNSIKFTDEGGTIGIVAQEHTNELELIVSDNGAGMNQETINNLLTEHSTASLSGFGLQISKTFIERNSGELYVESEEGKGTRFHIFLPKGNKSLKQRVHKNYNFIQIDSENAHDIDLKPDMKSMLVIDDDVSTADLLKEYFSALFSVSLAFDGLKGLKVARETVPDIIISDVNMPYLDGNNLCRELKSKKETSHVPILLISSQKLTSDQLKGYDSGADDYILKPLNLEVLNKKIEKLLEKNEEYRRANDENSFSFTLPESIEDKFLRKTTLLIAEKIGDSEFSVEKLAEEVGMSRSQLYRKFKAVLGVSPMDYIKNMRLQKALTLLLTEKYRVSEIAYEVGFSDYKYFTTCFTKAFGASPTNYLQQKKNSQ